MSFKTQRLVDLFPDAYAAGDRDGLLYTLLDALGAELMVADEAIKQLLKSHWVDYATAAGLDGLGATFGVTRRRLRDGVLEGDDAFRQRLKSVVPLFTGGGTVRAVQGAVRSALGLPFDLAQLTLPPALRADLERVVAIEEFAPTTERVIFDAAPGPDGLTELIIPIDIPAVRGDRPIIDWRFSNGSGRLLTIERLDTLQGVRADESLVVVAGQQLVLSAASTGRLTALLDDVEVTTLFTGLDGGSPLLPEVPGVRSEWRFRAQGGAYDISSFDASGDAGDAYDAPTFQVEMSFVRRQPLTFDVIVPYFVNQVVAQLVARHGYQGDVFIFEGLPLEALPAVVDQTRAAGVRGRVHFSLTFLEDHQLREARHQQHGQLHTREDAAGREGLVLGSVEHPTETHTTSEQFAIGGVFDISTFDRGHGLV